MRYTALHAGAQRLLTRMGVLLFLAVVLSACGLTAQVRLAFAETGIQRVTKWGNHGEKSGVRFIPSSDGGYNSPIWVHLLGIHPGDEVRVHFDGEPEGRVYEGPFWLNTSTELTAVVQGKLRATASYTIVDLVPIVDVEPIDTAKYIGGVHFVVMHPVSNALYSRSVNDSDFTDMLQPNFILDRVGRTMVTIKAVHPGAITSYRTLLYEIVDPLPPKISHAPVKTYHSPINITFTDPIGRQLPFILGDDPSTMLSYYADQPGEYNVRSTYTDNLFVDHTTRATLQLSAAALPPPNVFPRCGTTFPRTSVILRLSVPQQDPVGSRGLNITATADSAQLDVATALGDGNFSVVLRPFSLTEVGVTPVVLRLQATSATPLQLPSAETSCSFTFAPNGDKSTTYFSLRPRCAAQTDSGAVNAPCNDMIQRQVAECLRFGTTDLIVTETVGPFMLLAVKGLPGDLQQEFHDALGKCLASGSADVDDVKDESMGEMALATMWSLASGTKLLSGSDAQTKFVAVGQSIWAEVSGYGLSQGLYHLVRAEHTCEDIGIVPVVIRTDKRRDAPQRREAVALLFLLRHPGEFILCARFGDTVYRIPSSIRAEARAVDVFPTLSPSGSSSCGGMIEVPSFSMSFQVTPPSSYTTFYVGINAGSWSHVPLNTTLQVGPFNESEVPVGVVSATLGPETGAAQVCVFYGGNVNGGIPLDNVTYTFYEVGDGSRRRYVGETTLGIATEVVLILRGQFASESRIVVKILPPQEQGARALHGGGDGSVQSTSSTVMNSTLALPDTSFRVPVGRDSDVFEVDVFVDDKRVDILPATVALSSLALAMQACISCASGYCFEGDCVCIDNKTKFAFLCSAAAGGGNGQGKSAPHTSMSERVILLSVYFLLLSATGLGFYYAIRQGTRKWRAMNSVHDVIIVSADAPSSTPPAREV